MNTTKIWDAACKTDPSATKTSNQGGRQQTSIDGYWMMRKATELFGPIGIGWGYEVMEERLDDGAPAVLSGGEGQTPMIINTKTHTIKIKFWYVLDGVRGEIPGVYGHTPALYRSKHGVSDDGEAPKKSLTDAIKKALSFLGFCADVFMGEFDDRDYVEAAKTEAAINKAADRDAEVQAKREELSKYVTDHVALIDRAASVYEVAGIEKVVLRNLERHKALPDLKDIAEKGIKKIATDSAAKKTQLAGEK